MLSKTGVGGYSQYLKQDFVAGYHNKEGNQCIYFLSAHIVKHHAKNEDIHAAWQSRMDGYEGTVCLVR